MRLAFVISTMVSLASFATAQSFHETDLLQFREETEDLFGESNRTFYARRSLVYHVFDQENEITAVLDLDEAPRDVESCLRSSNGDPDRAIANCHLDCFGCELGLFELNGAIGYWLIEPNVRQLTGIARLYRDGSMLKIEVHSPHRDVAERGLQTLLNFAARRILPQDS